LRTQYTEDVCNALDVPEDERSPAEQAWAEARLEANQVMASLQAGEPFAALAAAYSDDPSAADNGLLGWSASDGYVDPFAEAINTADIGAYVGPVCTEFGWHIIQVLDRELRDIPEFEFRNQQNTTYQEWEQEVRSRATIERREDWQDRIPEDPSYEDLLGDIIPLN
jgi:parvulin-like peptidyl-prolyl isomerase